MNGKQYLVPVLLALLTVLVGAFLANSQKRDDRQDARLETLFADQTQKLKEIREARASGDAHLQQQLSMERARAARL